MNYSSSQMILLLQCSTFPILIAFLYFITLCGYAKCIHYIYKKELQMMAIAEIIVFSSLLFSLATLNPVIPICIVTFIATLLQVGESISKKQN